MANNIRRSRGVQISEGGGSDPTLAARVTVLENNLYEIEYWASISSASGTITVPTGATIRLGQWQGGIDALVSTISSGQPSGIIPTTAGGASVTVTSFDTAGNYTLSGTPNAFPVALLYVFQIAGVNLSNVNLNNELNRYDMGGGSGTVTSVSGTANRITSTGGATPVIDISATFEALLGKVASPLSQFASTSSTQLAGVLSDETGTGLVVFNNAPSLINPTVGTQTQGDNSTKAASTAYVDTGLSLKSNLVSPTFTGTPAAPTASAGTSTTQLATTAFVTTSIQGNALGYAIAAGTNTYTASLSPALAAYATGQMFEIVFTNANTTTATININSLGAKSLVKNGSTALISGDISAGQAYSIFYDGTNFQLLSKIFNVAGSNTQVQYNDSGVQAGSTDFLWSKTAGNLMLGASALVKGWLNLGASTAIKPHMNLLDGVTTTDTTNGNFWRVGVDWFFRSASYVAKNMWQDQPNSALSGTGTVVGQLDLNGTWSRGNTITPFGNFSQISSVTINTTSKTSIYLADGAGSKTIPSTYWAIGKVTYSKHFALVTTAASAGTAQFIVYIGGVSGTLLVDTGAITLPNSITNQGFSAKVTTTCITIGASGSLISAIELYLNTTLLGVFVGSAISSINLTGSLDYEVTLTLSAGSTTNKFVFNQGNGGYEN